MAHSVAHIAQDKEGLLWPHCTHSWLQNEPNTSTHHTSYSYPLGGKHTLGEQMPLASDGDREEASSTATMLPQHPPMNDTCVGTFV
ncbi:hypothetical protein E2C01_017411 [Portunus trituberculatus]|uniref:Uncharacterized protein n=1 Tax=Portunus trituberculatus TaxID=210409 RepID=A0A5B7DRT0_PORTR|nr:hypothetical protein [Portunus trituberculatus]